MKVLVRYAAGILGPIQRSLEISATQSRHLVAGLLAAQVGPVVEQRPRPHRVGVDLVGEVGDAWRGRRRGGERKPLTLYAGPAA